MNRDDPNNSAASSTPIFTVPNVLCSLRLTGAPVLIVLAIAGLERWFVALFLLMSLTDWLDGKLAVWLKQESAFGARLDSLADFTMYAGLAIGTVILKPYELLAEWPWLAPTLLTYTGHVIAGLVKFRKVPSYHTYMAKASWLLIAIGAITFLLGYSPWPLRTALAAITITNLEAIAITRVLPTLQSNIPTIFHARRHQPNQ